MDRKSFLCQHCGKCCESIVLPVQKPLEKSVMLEWLEARGGEIVAEQPETWYIKLNSPCPRLEKSGGRVLCKGYENRPQGCRIFDGTTLDWLDCAWKDPNHYVVKAAPIKWQSKTGLENPDPKSKPQSTKPKSSPTPHFTGREGRVTHAGRKPVMGTDQRKRMNRRKALERKITRHEDIQAYGHSLED